MNSYEETIQTWNKLADVYKEGFMDLDLYDETYEAFCALLPEKASILELGCGPGNITKQILNRRPDMELLATDVAPSMVLMTQKEVPNAQTAVMDARNLSSLQGRFDGIVCGFVLPYLSFGDIEQLAIASFEKLHKGSLLYWSYVPGNPGDSGFKIGSTGDRTYFYYHDESRIDHILSENGFDLLNKWNVTYGRADGTTENHRIQLVKKKE